MSVSERKAARVTYDVQVASATGDSNGEYAVATAPDYAAWISNVGKLERLLGIEAVMPPGAVKLLGGFTGLGFVDVAATAGKAGCKCQLDSDGIWKIKLGGAAALGRSPKPLTPEGYAITGYYYIGDLRVSVAEPLRRCDGGQ